MECVTACMSMLLPLRGLVRATVPLCLVGDFISSNDEWPRFLSTYIWTTTDDLYNGTYLFVVGNLKLNWMIVDINTYYLQSLLSVL